MAEKPNYSLKKVFGLFYPSMRKGYSNTNSLRQRLGLKEIESRKAFLVKGNAFITDFRITEAEARRFIARSKYIPACDIEKAFSEGYILADDDKFEIISLNGLKIAVPFINEYYQKKEEVKAKPEPVRLPPIEEPEEEEPEVVVPPSTRAAQADSFSPVSNISFAESFMNSVYFAANGINISTFVVLAKQAGYRIKQREFFEYLHDEGYLTSTEDERNVPTEKALEEGLFRVKENTIEVNGKKRISISPKMTGKGQIYFFKKIAEKGGLY